MTRSTDNGRDGKGEKEYEEENEQKKMKEKEKKLVSIDFWSHSDQYQRYDSKY